MGTPHTFSQSSHSGARGGGGGSAPILHKTKGEIAPALFRLVADGALFRSAFNLVDIPMALLDAKTDGRPIVQTNRAFLDYFALTETETLAHSLPQLILHEDKNAESRLFGSSASARVRLRTTRKDGVSLHVDITVNPLRDFAGRQTHWIVSIVDRGEIEQLRAEVSRLKGGAAS